MKSMRCGVLYVISFLLVSVASMSLYSSNPQAHDLIDLRKEIPTAYFDIRYATTNNFTKQKVYSKPACYLHKTVLEKLKKAQDEFLTLGYSILCYDGFRPQEAQIKFWELVPDERYVMNPKKISRHSRGVAIDLTLADAKTGKAVVMPTEFDDFTHKAHRDYKGASPEALKNCALLERVMTKHGFAGLKTEWWHFDEKDWKNYGLIDVSFDDLD